MLVGRTSTKVALRIQRLSGIRPLADFPVYLCPILLRQISQSRWLCSSSRSRPSRLDESSPRRIHLDAREARHQDGTVASIYTPRLPQQCPGCGALSQTHDGQEAGFYSLERRSVKAYMNGRSDAGIQRKGLDDQVYQDALLNSADPLLENDSLGVTERPLLSSSSSNTKTPVCDRCHKLLHHHTGVSIHHPSIDAIKMTLAESPHKYNHVYHIIDAADFPMSLIPGLQRLLNLSQYRTQNRRSKVGRFYRDKIFEVSFIITRSDLLAPLKSQVDSLMPYLTSVLREALGSIGRNVRLGNVRCVSAKRGWWTKELKEDVWGRGGGGWMVGKVNVGKSQLFESVFPKGRRRNVKLGQPLEDDIRISDSGEHTVSEAVMQRPSDELESPSQWSIDATEPTRLEAIEENALLPPAQPETDYPAMPLVSALPGTTASPIRVPFGNGKGELIDLPGLSRGNLDLYVQESHRHSLVMKSRVVPEQQVVKSGQSLLLGGLIRITPVHPDIVILGYAFTPIHSHLTSTEKAIGIQLQNRESTVENVGKPGIGDTIKSAGIFPLKWDVTKQRSGPLTASDAVGLKVEKLPYRVLSTDILIEGCGWVELVAQVRKKAMERAVNQHSGIETDENNHQLPEVEVFSPRGKFIAARRPLGAWLLAQKKSTPGTKARPRRSMKGVKKRTKNTSKIMIEPA